MTNSDIIQTLIGMKNGDVLMDINAKFNEVLQAVLETAGKGELTIKLKVSPSRRASTGEVVEVEATHECLTKKPELAIGRSLFFVTKEGVLTRDDPAQVAMFEEEIQRQRKEVTFNGK